MQFPTSYNDDHDDAARTVGHMHRHGGRGNAVFAGIAINEDPAIITPATIMEQLDVGDKEFQGVFVTGWSGTVEPDWGDDPIRASDFDDPDEDVQFTIEQILLSWRQSQVAKRNIHQFIDAIGGMEPKRVTKLLDRVLIGHMDVDVYDDESRCPFYSPKLGHSVALLQLNKTRYLTLRMLAFNGPLPFFHNLSIEGIMKLKSYLISPECAVEELRIEVICNCSTLQSQEELPMVPEILVDEWRNAFWAKRKGMFANKSIKKLSLAIIKPQRCVRSAALPYRGGWFSRCFQHLVNEGELLSNLNCLELDGFALHSEDLECMVNVLWNSCIWNTSHDSVRIRISRCAFLSDPKNPHHRAIPTKTFIIPNPLSKLTMATSIGFADPETPHWQKFLKKSLELISGVQPLAAPLCARQVIKEWHNNVLNLYRHIGARTHFAILHDFFCLDPREVNVVDTDAHELTLLYEYLRGNRSDVMTLIPPIENSENSTKKRSCPTGLLSGWFEQVGAKRRRT